MITSKDNEKLRTIRRLRARRQRERGGLVVAEGEDLVAAAEAAGVPAEFVLRAGVDVEPKLLDAVSELGSGTRVIGVFERPRHEPGEGTWVYLHGVGDPGNVGAIVRTAHALLADGTVALGPGCADPGSAKALRASMGSLFAQPVVEARPEELPGPLVGMVAHGGQPPDDRPVGTLCLGAEREGLPDAVSERCERLWTIPLAPGGAESLNVAAAAAIALGRISSAGREGT